VGMVAGGMSVELIASEQRFSTDIGWLRSKHSFSFGSQYDPKHVGHGLLLVSNDDVVAAGTGFDTHPHRDMEIVTWVLSARLTDAGHLSIVGAEVLVWSMAA
jgi:quercetin 2,3-dioxygenase